MFPGYPQDHPIQAPPFALRLGASVHVLHSHRGFGRDESDGHLRGSGTGHATPEKKMSSISIVDHSCNWFVVATQVATGVFSGQIPGLATPKVDFLWRKWRDQLKLKQDLSGMFLSFTLW